MNRSGVIETLRRPALEEIARSVGARRCLVDLGTYGGEGPFLCQVITQGGQAGLNIHRQVVHGIEAPR